MIRRSGRQAHRDSTRGGQARRRSAIRQLKRARGGDLRGTGGRARIRTRGRFN